MENVKGYKVGYVRVSTEEQNEARQLETMRKYGVDEVFTEKASGKNADRKELKKLLSFVRRGDAVIVESISRIARNTKDLLEIVGALQEKGVDFVSAKEAIDTTTPQGQFMLTVFGAMAQLEREQILQRQREGIAIAKAEGKYKGRAKIDADAEKMRGVCQRWRAGEITAREAMAQTGLKPNTFYRRVKEMGL